MIGKGNPVVPWRHLGDLVLVPWKHLGDLMLVPVFFFTC